MTEDEFPPLLLERCAKAMRRDAIMRTTNGRGFVDPTVQISNAELDVAASVLREIDYTRLVAKRDAYRALLGEVLSLLKGSDDMKVIDVLDHIMKEL